MADRVDDGSIADDEVLWRRVIPNWIQHEADGSCRPQSVAFKDRLSYELSVNVGRLTNREQMLATRPGDSIVAFPARIARRLGLKVVPDPDEGDISHALLCPTPETKSAKEIAKNSTWVVLQDQACSNCTER